MELEMKQIRIQWTQIRRKHMSIGYCKKDIANALELRLSCTKPSMWYGKSQCINPWWRILLDLLTRHWGTINSSSKPSLTNPHANFARDLPHPGITRIQKPVAQQRQGIMGTLIFHLHTFNQRPQPNKTLNKQTKTRMKQSPPPSPK